MGKYKIIVNPTSGRGYAGRAITQIEEILKSSGLVFDVEYTEKQWHAAEIAARAAREGYEAVISASGDGTANEVLNGLMRAQKEGYKNTTMGILAVGTGNDFAYGMGIPAGVEAGCKILVENYRQSMDVGLLKGGDYPDGRYFGNGVGVGFDAETGFVAAKIRWIRGLLLYLIAAIETIFIYYKAPKVKIQYDENEIVQSSLMISIMNGRRMGGGFFFAPNGDPADGRFDLCIAESASKVRIFQLIPYFLKGTQATQKEVKTGHATRVNITSIEGKLPVHCDGETVCYGGIELSIELLPHQLEFITQKPA
jgi:diacylglycerol kinase (ATP)